MSQSYPASIEVPGIPPADQRQKATVAGRVGDWFSNFPGDVFATGA